MHKLLLVLLVSLLTGCGANPMIHVSNAVFNFGQELPEDMVNVHYAGVVAFDEVAPPKYPRIPHINLYANGIKEGSPEYEMRATMVHIANTGELLYVSKGDRTFATAAIIPDHLPVLKAGDLIEIRNTKTWRVDEDFLKTGEGNIVVSIICAKADPQFDNCIETKAPRLGKHKGRGPTGTPYPKSVKDYGFTFTPKYDQKGNPVR